MVWRIALVVPVSLILWWFGWNMLRGDEENWLLWLGTTDASSWYRTTWMLIMFATTAAIAASLVLFYCKTPMGFLGILTVAYLFANVYGASWASAGPAMDPRDFVALVVAMTASFPMLFSQLVSGKLGDLGKSDDDE